MKLANFKQKDKRIGRCIWNFGEGTSWSLFSGGKAGVALS
jgi:hypothetical protein